MLWPIIGTIAATCTTIGFIPQIIQGVKTKELKDVSPVMLTLLLVGCSLWLLYGVSLKDHIIILANAFTISFIVTILFLRTFFNWRSEKRKISADIVS